MVAHPIHIREGPVNHLVGIYTIKEFFEMRLRFNDVAHTDTAPDFLLTLDITPGFIL